MTKLVPEPTLDDSDINAPEPVITTDSTKKRGRPRNENFLPWEEARAAVREEMIPSRGKFEEWWDRHKPKSIPRFPYRVYTGENEWVSWNDFLGTNNKFNEKMGIKWRPMMDAVRWAMALKLKSQAEWLEFCRGEGNLPEDIPIRPDLVYKQWRSWTHWLGNRPVDAVQTHQELAKHSQVFYIIHEHDVPGNVMTFGVEPGGVTAMKQRWEENPYDVTRLFWYDPTKAETVKNIVNSLSTPYLGNERQRIVPNVWEIVWHMQMNLEMITKFNS